MARGPAQGTCHEEPSRPRPIELIWICKLSLVPLQRGTPFDWLFASRLSQSGPVCRRTASQANTPVADDHLPTNAVGWDVADLLRTITMFTRFSSSFRASSSQTIDNGEYGRSGFRNHKI